MLGNARLVVAGALATVLLLVAVPEGTADCCQAILKGWPPKKWCKDCSMGTPCCGVGQCNIFCCNCGGGCRKGDCHPSVSRDDLDLARVTGHTYIAQGDKDGDGKLDLEEVAHLLGSLFNTTVGRVRREFQKMDEDSDGKLSADEIDSPDDC